MKITRHGPLRVVLCTAGTFHFFDLARELEARGVLSQIHSSFHWSRLRREALPRERVHCFAPIHPAYMLACRLRLPLSRTLARRIEWVNSVCLDRWVEHHLPECDVFSALSNNGLRSGQRAQRRGAKYICDRGCAHIRFQRDMVLEEYRRWKIPYPACDARTVAREEAEYAAADAFVVPSEFSRQSFLQMGVPAAKVNKIALGVNLEKFYPEGEPAPGSFEILYAGQVCFRKGIPTLFEAFARFRHPRKKLRIAGGISNEMHAYLRQNMPPGVTMLGPVTQSELRRLMSRSHVLVLPSVEDGFGMVLNQAMACGCPIIATTNTGGSDLCTDGVEGFIVPIRAPEAICQRFEQLADEPDLRARMSCAAMERVRQLGGWQEYGEHYMALMQRLVAQ